VSDDLEDHGIEMRPDDTQAIENAKQSVAYRVIDDSDLLKAALTYGAAEKPSHKGGW